MMGKFKFTLEPVLDHRERIEDEKQQVLAERSRELKAAEDELARLNGEFKRYSTALREDHAKLTSEELRWHYAHLEYLDRCMTMQHGIIFQRRAAVERARADLVTASKDRKVIEKLKDRRLEEHQAFEAAQEQKELDDTNNRRFARTDVQ
ncbi:MAG TPA: flagellar export protein FliJ [Candidatus Baltobacteraceae bacterium]|nr:flagellar export protein FliJ [Candidatus Baltobacteraceae bacterium]